MKQIEQFFEDHSGREFGAGARDYPYRVIAPTDRDTHMVFATKWGCLLEGLDKCGPPAGLGMIIRYGLPSREDLSWLASTIGHRRVLFLGDLDPTDLLIYLWLRSNLEQLDFKHFGVNDRFLSALGVDIPASYMINLDAQEVDALALVEACWPNVEATIGPQCVQALRSGRKIEQEAIVSRLSSGSAILSLLEQTASNHRDE